MADKTQNYGLNKIAAGGTLAEDGYKFGSRDRETIDALLGRLFAHDHFPTTAAVQSPVGSLTATVSSTGGTLPAGKDRYYKFSFLDSAGNETAASVETFVEMPNPLSPLSAPTLTLATSGGTLGTGLYKYAVGQYQTLSSTVRTTASSEAFIDVPTGSTNEITLTLPPIEAGADGWDIWRKAPSDSAFYLLDQQAAVDEIQTVYNGASSGTFTLTFDGQETGNIAYDATAAVVEAALILLSNIVDVDVTGIGTSGDPWTITFLDPGGYDVATLQADDTNLVGGTSTVATPTPGGSLTYVDDGGTSPTVGTTRTSVNTTNSQNSVTLTVGSQDLPIPSGVAGWRIYRTQRSGVYEANSLLATITATIVQGGETLRNTFLDTGGLLATGFPLEQSTVPALIPQVGNAAPLTFFLPVSQMTGSSKTFAQFDLEGGDFNVRRMDAYFADAPDCDGSNFVTIIITDNNPLDEIQVVSHDGTGGSFTLSLDGDATSAIQWDDAAATVETRLQTDIAAITDVDVSGSAGGPWTITFVDPGAQDVSLMTADDTNLTGSLEGITVVEQTKGKPTTEFTLPVTGTAAAWSGEPSYWTWVEVTDSQEAETADTLNGGTVENDSTASNGQVYRINAATDYSRWTVGNVPTGDYLFRFVLKQNATDDTVQVRVWDIDAASSVVAESVNPGQDSNFTLYELETTISSGSNDLRMEINGLNTSIYDLDSFEYINVRDNPVVFKNGDTVSIEMSVDGTPTDNGDHLNIVIS